VDPTFSADRTSSFKVSLESLTLSCFVSMEGSIAGYSDGCQLFSPLYRCAVSQYGFPRYRYGFIWSKPYGVSRWCGGQWDLVYGFMVLLYNKLVVVIYKGIKSNIKGLYIYIRVETKTRNQISADFGL
jgi:hypothetical protein